MNTLDPACYVEAKRPKASAHVSLLVVGGGEAGTAAAIAAAKLGISTLLIEEHPVPAELMALDVPLHFGQRMARTSGNAGPMEHILESRPDLAEAYELGIDVQLGVCVWGVFPGHPLLVGLADADRSWFVSCERIIVASGARDLCIGFSGWEKPGVMGAQAALQLIERYDTFTGSKMVVLGGGALGLRVVESALKHGIAVAGVVEIDGHSEAAETANRLDELSVPYYPGHLIARADGAAEVETAVIARPDGTQITLACDTLVMAIGTVPNIEILDVLNCQLDFDTGKGGWIPRRDPGCATTVPMVYAVGDCAGLGGDVIAEGRRAAVAVAKSLGLPIAGDAAAAVTASISAEPSHAQDRSVERARIWMRAQVALGGLDVPVCQCEEVTRREVIELRPPRYLACGAGRTPARGLRALAADGPLNQDQVKRLTRAGMGPCQGRRCREQIQILMEADGSLKPGLIPLARYRMPVRPLPAEILAAEDENAALRDHWVAWFNISTQWLAHWEMKPAPLPTPGQAPVIGESE